MGTNFPHILAISTTAAAFAAVLTGAYLTSGNALAGFDLGNWKAIHNGISTAAAAGATGLAFTVSGRFRAWLISSVLLTALPGGLLEVNKTALAGLAHAVAASALTSVCAVAALQLSASWVGEPATIADEGSPSLQALARASWISLLFQTALGALYRHQIVGLLPHVAGAMLVIGMVMYAGIATFSTENAPKHIKNPALTLLIMTSVQMLIGLGAYLYRIEFREQATGQSAMLIFTVMHVAVGALTTACSALMGMQILRHVRPAVVAQ